MKKIFDLAVLEKKTQLVILISMHPGKLEKPRVKQISFVVDVR
jgi:hypothetical protein